MTILYIHNNNLESRMANVVQVISMCKAFAQKGNQIVLLSPTSGNTHFIESKIRDEFNIPINVKLLFFKSYPRLGKYQNIHNLFQIKYFLKIINPDFCFVRNSIFLRICISNKYKTFYEAHNSELYPRITYVNKILKNILLKSSKNEYLIKFITISNALSDYWSSFGISREKIIPLHDGFEPSAYVINESIDNTRLMLNLPINKKIVVYTGSLYNDRNIDHIILLADEFKEVTFVVVGGPEQNKLYYETRTKNLGLTNILFTGHKHHKLIPKYLYSADILLAIWSSKVPTINYCSPLKIFEYMATKRLIVSIGFPTIKEILTDKYDSYLAEPDNFESLKQNLALALNDINPQIFSENAYNKAHKMYSWQRRVDKILTIYSTSKTNLVNNY